MLLCASPDYLARHGTPQKPKDLSQHNCLGYMFSDRRSHWRLIGPNGEQRVQVRGNFVATHGPALRTAALAGMGIVMQPTALLADDVAAGRLIALLASFAPPARPMHLVYLPERRMTPKLRSFVDFVTARFARTGPSAPASKSK
jgi:DNA-binding transcriptional LysR family regulator